MSDYWAQGDWQLQMYAWLRSQQPGAAPVVAGVLLYVNELALSIQDIGPLQREVAAGQTDVCPQPGSRDDYLLRTWRPGAGVPAFSDAFRMARVIRVLPITQPSINQALQRFNNVVVDIESCVRVRLNTERSSRTGRRAGMTARATHATFATSARHLLQRERGGKLQPSGAECTVDRGWINN